MPNPFALPVHPAVAHFPVAMLTVAWVCLIVRYASGDLRWDGRARLFEVVGVVFLVPTITAGFIDTRGFDFVLHPHWNRPIIWHMIAGLIATSAFSGHLVWRRDKPSTVLIGRLAVQDVLIVSFGMTALLAAGLLGGELAFLR